MLSKLKIKRTKPPVLSIKTKPSKDQTELLGPSQHYCGSGESIQRRNGIEEEAHFWNNLWWSGKNIEFCLHSKFTLSKNVWSIFVYSFIIAFLKKKISTFYEIPKKYLIMIVKGHTSSYWIVLWVSTRNC